MYILFDLGGTNTRVAVSHNGKQLDEVLIIKTPQNYKDGIFALSELAKSLARGKKIIKTISGVAGPLDSKKTKLLSGNLKNWNNRPLQKDLKNILKCPVTLENDAALAGLGEALFGAGKGHAIIGYMTFSTGIGGVKIIDGKIDKNDFGFEPRRQILESSSRKTQKLGSLISGNAIKQNYGLAGHELIGKKQWSQIEKYMAEGIANSALLWSTATMVVGGPVFFNKNISPKRINLFLKHHFKNMPRVPTVKPAKLKDLSGLYGALALAKSK